jgi:hypothetical protein
MISERALGNPVEGERDSGVKAILKNSLDAVPLSPPRPTAPPLTHDNLRGADYFDQGGPRSC